MTLDEVLKQTLLEKVPVNAESLSAARKLLIQKKVSSEDDYAQVLTWLFPWLLKTLKETTGTDPLRVMCSDTLAICLLRASQLAAASSEFTESFRSVLIADDSLDSLFNYIVDYWDESGAPLSNSLRDVFTKLVALLEKYDFSQKLFQNWTKITLKIRKERRVLYYLIETLSKELNDPHFIINQDPSFIEESLKLISSNALGNLIGKSITAILKKLYTNEDEANQWIYKFWKPIKLAIKDNNLRQGVVSNLLPNLFKISKSAFKTMVDEFQYDVEIFITFLNIGQQLVIEEPYPNLVDKSTIERLLTHNDYKIKVFQILTFSPKGSKTINLQILDILKNNLELFFIDTEVETRNEFISLFKQFLYRIKDSGYALNRDASKLIAKNKFIDEANEKLSIVQSYKEFLVWLIDLIKFQLFSGSQYQRIITSLKLLKQLVESNLDPTIFFKVDINHAFQISIFQDDELIRLLFNNVSSTYDDIREISSYLLILSNPKIDDSNRNSLINKSFKLLNDYGKSESGAKFLQLCHSLFKDDSIFIRLIDEIPLNSDIFEAVKNPVDGFFHAMTLILPQLVDKSLINSNKIINIIETNWNTVKEILSHDSPEGCDQYGVGSAQLVLSYGWRSTKESTLLLTKLMDSTKFSDDELIRIGELTLDQLSTVRHRGAFSSVYPTFIKLASICTKQIPGQNKQWLDFNISLIQTKTQLITRRSGGLPFLITAILTVERGLFQYAFDKLIEIAKEPVNESEDESEKMDIAQVHAFNCIKTLFIESQLSNSCAPYIYSALSLALSTFSSRIWSVRNCSIMLFTALQNRLFGYKKMSARVFFTRFKGIKEILISILKDSTKDEINLETLFPVLTILSKLQSTPGYDGLSEFNPLLRSCLTAKYWKVRECASWALPALVPSFIEESLYLINSCSVNNQNQLHGHLLAINKLLEEIDNNESKELFSSIIDKAIPFLAFNPSFVTRKAYLEIIKTISLKDKNLLDNELIEFLIELFLQDNEVYELDGSKQLYLKTLFNLIINRSFDENLLSIGLNSDFFEVKLESIKYCSEYNINHDELLSIALNEDEWIFVRSKAIPLVSKFSIDKAVEFVSNQNIYGEDIKCSGLKLLGSLMAQSNSNEAIFKRWIELLILNSDEDEPFTIRVAALISSLRYLEFKKSSKVEYLVYKFLSDDDDEIRELASDYFNKNIVPWVNSKKFSEKFGNNEEDAKVIVDETLNIKFNQYDKADDTNVLFSIEKKNFYKNSIEDTIQFSKMLKNSWPIISKEGKEKIIQHIDELFNQSLSLIQNVGSDDKLGWGINEEIFDEIYNIFYLKKQHGSKQELNIQTNLHPTLYNILA